MKNLIKYISIFCLILTTSCIDEDPIDQIGEGAFYKNTEDINQAVMACYNGLQSTIKEEWYLTELRSDNSRHYGSASTATNSKNIYALDNFRVETTHPVVRNYWEATYHNIANCNTVIKHLGVVSNETLKKQFEGEALFLRSYHYFNLVRLYGPLFIVTERIGMEEANKAERSSVEKVYELIENDLKTVIGTDGDPLLPRTYEATQKGRADIWAAKSLLAKVYLTLGRLSEAKTLLKDVEANSKYGLVKNNYGNVFSISNEMNEEIIFTVRFKAGGFGLGSPFANSFAPNNSSDMIINVGGDGNNCPSSDLIAAYEAKDLRKDITLAETWINPNGQIVYTAYTKKYLSQVQTKYDAENDWPLIRFADIILMLGEIENELSGPNAGLPYINQTRTRAGLDPLVAGDVPTKYAFRLAMEKERRLEFAFENHRLFDLMRTDRLVTIMKNHYDTEQIANSSTGVIGSYYDDSKNESYLLPSYRTLQSWQMLLPIPYAVMTVAPNATQNPGY